MALVGYMGSGKTTVGRSLAHKLDREFLDLDREITRRAGCSIPEIFSSSGEERFRELESEALADALGAAERVIACGGGVVTCAENRRLLLDGASVVFLEEDPGVLYKRTRGADRPLRSAGYDEFEERYAERLPHYLEVADLRLPAQGRTGDRLAEEILRWLSG